MIGRRSGDKSGDIEAISGRIEDCWLAASADPSFPLDIEAIEEAITLLDTGQIRVAEPSTDGWHVNEWAKKAILMYFQSRSVETTALGPFEYHDKIPLKRGFGSMGVRAVPPAVARYGSYLSPSVILMPSYVNIGAWVGPRTMVDTWATVGSCAQIGADVHLAGGVGIGGVLEPLQSRPVIIEDGVFIGSRCVVVEGVRVGAGAVLGTGVMLTSSTPVIDVTGDEPKEHRGFVPPGAVVIPGSRPREFAAGSYGLPCGLIIGQRNAGTNDKVRLNQLLRDFGSSTG